MSIDRRSLPLILSSLPFEPGRWVVAGSAPMLMSGLIDSISDIDVVVDGTAWQQAEALSDQQVREGLRGDLIVEIDVDGSLVEVFDGWLGRDAAEMIAEGIELEGFRFSPLSRVLDSKRRLSRAKDQRHIELLEAHLEEGRAATGQ